MNRRGRDGSRFPETCRPRNRCAGHGALRLVHPLLRCLPDPGFSETVRTRCEPVHLVLDDRAPGRDPRRSPCAYRRTFFRMRYLPAGVPVESSCAGADRSGVRAAPLESSSVSGGARNNTGEFRRDLFRIPVAAAKMARPRTQRGDRHRQSGLEGIPRRARAS